MTTNMKMHPTLKDDVCYQPWVHDVKVWCMFTDLSKTKRGPAVYLSLAGKARDAVTYIDVEAIGKDDGVDIIIKKLDEVFLKDKNTLAYNFQNVLQFSTYHWHVNAGIYC